MRKWIDQLATAYDAKLEARHRETLTPEQMTLDTAFDRVRSEIRDVVSELQQRFGERFVLSDLDNGRTTLVRARIATNTNQATRFDFNAHDGTIHTHPAAGFAAVPPQDRHTFTFDAQSGSFLENGVVVTDEELVERAMQPFLKHNLNL